MKVFPSICGYLPSVDGSCVIYVLVLTACLHAPVWSAVGVVTRLQKGAKISSMLG